jgi:hypothetical protein
MRVDNRVNQPHPRNRDNEATSRSADLCRNRTRAELPAQDNRTRANADGPSQGGNSNCEVVPHRAPAGGGRDPDGGGRTTEAPTTEPTGGPAAAAVAEVETTRIATPLEPHRVATTPARRLKSCGGRSQPLQATTTASRLLTSTSQLAPPRQVQAFGDHQV